MAEPFAFEGDAGKPIPAEGALRESVPAPPGQVIPCPLPFDEMRRPDILRGHAELEGDFDPLRAGKKWKGSPRKTCLGSFVRPLSVQPFEIVRIEKKHYHATLGIDEARKQGVEIVRTIREHGSIVRLKL